MVRRITKKEFYSKGGFKNSNLFRKQTASGSWCYYEGATDIKVH